MDNKHARCALCLSDLTAYSSFERVLHVNKCLNERLDVNIEPIEELSGSESDSESSEDDDILGNREDTVGMPPYENMSATELHQELAKYGVDRKLNLKSSREILKQTWLYVNKGIVPEFLKNYIV